MSAKAIIEIKTENGAEVVYVGGQEFRRFDHFTDDYAITNAKACKAYLESIPDSTGDSKPKFTPGPWRRIDKFIVAGSVRVAELYDRYFIGAAEIEVPKEANAALIAAAPEMYEALEDLISEMYRCGAIEYMNESSSYAKAFNKRLDKAMAVLKKARGES